MSLLHVIRAAVSPVAAEAVLPDNEPVTENLAPDAGASTIGANMAENAGAPGGAPNAGLSEADLTALIAKATGDGNAAGAKAASDRLSTILSAEGIAGDGKRMSAALDLAVKSPGMAASDVTAFVVANVGAQTAPAASYEQQRLAAAGLTEPVVGGARAGKSGLSAAVDSQIATMKRA